LKYLELIDNSRDDMIKMLQELLAFRSVVSDETSDMPFGKGVHEADCSDEPENLRNANNTTEKYYPSDS